VRVERQVQQPKPGLQVVLPDRRVPLEQLLAAPDVVDQHVEPAVVAVDPPDQVRDLLGLEMVGLHRDPRAAGGRDELGGLLDRLRAVVLRPLLARRAAGAVDGRPRLPQRDGRPAAGAARRAGDERHLAGEGRAHAESPSAATTRAI
jgi:hypothetical protein